MNKLFDQLKPLAPAVLRWGIAAVFLWFGSQQLIQTSMWLSFIPQSVIDISHLSASTLVHLNGSFEIIFGLALLFGYQTRIAALLLSLHMFEITSVVGYDAIGVRDFGLSVAALAVFLYGADEFGLDAWRRKKNAALN